MVDVQHRPLRSLKHHAAAIGQNPVQQAPRILNKRPYLLGRGRIFVVHLRRIQSGRPSAKQRLHNRIFLPAGRLNVRLQQIGTQKVHDAQSASRHLVLVRWTNPATRRPNSLPSRRALRGQLNHPVVGQNHLRPVRYKKLLVHPGHQLP